MIIDNHPALNRQVENSINPLKLFARSDHNHQAFVAVRTRNDISVDDNLNVNDAIVDISCFQEDESSSCAFQFNDVSKFKNNISLIISTIKKINFLIVS